MSAAIRELDDVAERPHPDVMTRIGRLLYDRADTGDSFQDMSRRAHTAGEPISAARLQQIAAGNNGKRLTSDAVRAVAKALELGPMAIATLDDEDHFMGPPTAPQPRRRKAV